MYTMEYLLSHKKERKDAIWNSIVELEIFILS